MQYVQFNPIFGLTGTEHGDHKHQTTLALMVTGGNAKGQILRFEVTKGNAMMRYIDALTAALIQQASLLGIRVDAGQTRQYVASRFLVKEDGTVTVTPKSKTAIQPTRTIHLLASEGTRFTQVEIQNLARKAHVTISTDQQKVLDRSTKDQIVAAFSPRDIKQPVLLTLSTLTDKPIHSWGALPTIERVVAFDDQTDFRQVRTEERVPAGVG